MSQVRTPAMKVEYFVGAQAHPQEDPHPGVPLPQHDVRCSRALGGCYRVRHQRKYKDKRKDCCPLCKLHLLASSSMTASADHLSHV